LTKKTDDAVGVEVKWSLHGFSAMVRSRLVSALDRSGSAKIDKNGLDVERQVAVHRAVTDSQLTLIAASTKALQKEISGDPDLARRALTVLSRAELQEDNIHGSLCLAIEDLQNRPIGDAESSDGPELLNPDFVNRWEHYASGATTELLREKWGRILASEVRDPNKISLKTLRVIDEIEQPTALLFQRLCEKRIGSWVPELTGGVDEHQKEELTEAGLLLPSDLPRTVTFGKTKREDETSCWILTATTFGMVVEKGIAEGFVGSLFDSPMHRDGEDLKLNVFALTQAGCALASIQEYSEENSIRMLVEAIQQSYGREFAQLVKRRADLMWTAVSAPSHVTDDGLKDDA
jgi:hypothetical protein